MQKYSLDVEERGQETKSYPASPETNKAGTSCMSHL